MDNIRLLIASEDASSRRGLTAIFASESLFNVLGSFSLEEAIEKSSLLQPDAVLLDLPDDILEYIPKIRQIKNECPFSLILALAENKHYEEMAGVLEQGLDGCVPRGIIRGCLVKAVELACLTGLVCLPSSIRKMISFTDPNKNNNNIINIGELKNNVSGSCGNLTRREMEILQLMAKNYSNREIAAKLYISEPTVKTHVSSILRKLGQNNRAQAIVYAYKIGLINDSLEAYE